MQATRHAPSSADALLPPLTHRSTRYLVTLFIALMSATIFDGYDTAIFHLCTPDIAKTFHMSDPAIGMMATTVRFGGMLSLLVVFFADCIGRKPVISITVMAYALFTLFTALSSGVGSFTLFQTCAQIFLVAEFGVAITMIAEEFPDESRGRAVSALHIVSLIGVTVAGLLYGRMAETHWGWRGLYLLGLGPLLLVAFLRRWLKETVRFVAVRATRTCPLGGFTEIVHRRARALPGLHRTLSRTGAAGRGIVEFDRIDRRPDDLFLQPLCAPRPSLDIPGRSEWPSSWPT